MTAEKTEYCSQCIGINQLSSWDWVDASLRSRVERYKTQIVIVIYIIFPVVRHIYFVFNSECIQYITVYYSICLNSLMSCDVMWCLVTSRYLTSRHVTSCHVLLFYVPEITSLIEIIIIEAIWAMSSIMTFSYNMYVIETS